MARVVAGASSPTLDVLYGLDEMSETLCRVLDTMELCRNVHPDPAWAEAANSAYVQLAGHMQMLNTEPRLYEAVDALLQEPRHSAGSIRRTAERVREAGYSPLWDFLASGNSRRRQEVGLVAGLVRGRFAFTAPPPPTLARWASRVQHVVHAFGRGDRQVHFINVYGHSGARSTAATREGNESFLLATGNRFLVGAGSCRTFLSDSD